MVKELQEVFDQIIDVVDKCITGKIDEGTDILHQIISSSTHMLDSLSNASDNAAQCINNNPLKLNAIICLNRVSIIHKTYMYVQSEAIIEPRYSFLTING